jgi:hypothetical protein
MTKRTNTYNNRWDDDSGVERGGRQSLGGKNQDQWEESGEQNLLREGRDDGFKPAHDLSVKFGGEFERSMAPWEAEKTWRPGPVSSGGEPRHSPKGDSGTHQRGPDDMTTESGSAVTPSDSKFYAKKGGPGQRSGA